MFGYIARRLLATIPVMAVVAVLVFMLLRFTAGDPAALLARDHRRRQRPPPGRGAHPGEARPGPADRPAVRHLVRQHPPRRFRRVVLLQENDRRADRRGGA